MSAGQPNWQKLYEMGKLPRDARGKVSGLVQLDVAEKRLEEVKKGVCDECRKKLFGVDTENKPKEEELHVSQCEVDGCEFAAKGRSEAIAKNNLRLHGKTHAMKA